MYVKLNLKEVVYVCKVKSKGVCITFEKNK